MRDCCIIWLKEDDWLPNSTLRLQFLHLYFLSLVKDFPNSSLTRTLEVGLFPLIFIFIKPFAIEKSISSPLPLIFSSIQRVKIMFGLPIIDYDTFILMVFRSKSLLHNWFLSFLPVCCSSFLKKWGFSKGHTSFGRLKSCSFFFEKETERLEPCSLSKESVCESVLEDFFFLVQLQYGALNLRLLGMPTEPSALCLCLKRVQPFMTLPFASMNWCQFWLKFGIMIVPSTIHIIVEKLSWTHFPT